MESAASYTLWPFSDATCSVPSATPLWIDLTLVGNCIDAVRQSNDGILHEYDDFLKSTDQTPGASLPVMDTYSFLGYKHAICIYDKWGCQGDWYDFYSGPRCVKPFYENQFSFRIVGPDDDPREKCKNDNHKKPDVAAYQANHNLQVPIEDIDNPELLAHYETPEWQASWEDPMYLKAVEDKEREKVEAQVEHKAEVIEKENEQVQEKIQDIEEEIEELHREEREGVPEEKIVAQEREIEQQLHNVQEQQQEIKKEEQIQDEKLEELEY